MQQEGGLGAADQGDGVTAGGGGGDQLGREQLQPGLVTPRVHAEPATQTNPAVRAADRSATRR